MNLKEGINMAWLTDIAWYWWALILGVVSYLIYNFWLK